MLNKTEVKTGDAVEAPNGFVTYAANAGIKDESLDLSIVASRVPCVAAGMFTQSRFAGPSVALCRRHLEQSSARAIVTISKNANVATGDQGERDAAELAALTAKVIGSDASEVLVGSTGVIGRPYPMERVRRHFQGLRMPEAADFPSVATAIMTTDTVPKLASARVGRATVTGVAKGSGMIEPHMATLLGYVVTDAAVPQDEMTQAFRRVVDVTFNSLSIDTDTSTSDTVLLLANGTAGPVGRAEFEEALREVCASLVLQLAADGEGATKVIEVTVRSARRRPGQTGGQSGRQFAAVEVRRARGGPELGPGGYGHRQVFRRYGYRGGGGAGQLWRPGGVPRPAGRGRVGAAIEGYGL